jgi:predicted O-linked N-acetylglucosamine transferase (SPINDLY family)
MLAIDYRLTDDWSDPPGVTDRYYTEKLVRLPRAFFCYRPFETPDVSPLPASTNGFVTFGSFNNYAKVMPEVVDAWLEILCRVPESRLLVLAYTAGYLEHRLREQARQKGISPERIELADKCSHDEYMRLVARVDIALDPFPFNGHTTTCDCIWTGVPVVMLAGDKYASRFGGSVLRHVGLDDLIAGSIAEYQDKAVQLAHDHTRLEHLRETLRPTMADSPLVDAVGFTRSLEAAYRQMWQQWCAGLQQAANYNQAD